MAKRSKQVEEKFLSSLREDPNVSLACDAANISRDTAYRWRDTSKSFAKAWDAALERTKDVARSSIYRRGILGWDEKVAGPTQVVMEYEPVVDEEGNQQFDAKGKPLFRGGKPLYIHKWSDTLAMGYAKANLPEYREKPQVSVQAQMSDLAEQAKQALLADLSASIGHEDTKPSDA